MNRTALFLSLSFSALVACGGSVDQESAASSNGSAPPADGSGTSTQTHDDPKLDAICDNVPGLTARAVLDQLSKFPTEMKATFRRFTYPPGPPAMDSPTSLTLRFRYESGVARCTPATPDPPGTLNPGVTPATVTLDVMVDLITGDGLFSESFEAAFSWTGALLNFEGTVPVSSLKGGYRTIATDDATGTATGVKFFGQMYPDPVEYSYGGVVHGDAYGHFDFK